MSLWRTARPRFAVYTPDGRGRDRYISYNNGGYWESQFRVTTKQDFERPKYTNFHTLYHFAAPFKYYPEGNGRESYIIGTNGLRHDFKPLCTYKLIDFLRGPREEQSPMLANRKTYLSQAEKRFNKKIRAIENSLIKRLYTEPMKTRKEKLAKTQTDLDSNKILTRTYAETLPEVASPIHKQDQRNNTISGFYVKKPKISKVSPLSDPDELILKKSNELLNYENQKNEEIPNESKCDKNKYPTDKAKTMYIEEGNDEYEKKNEKVRIINPKKFKNFVIKNNVYNPSNMKFGNDNYTIDSPEKFRTIQHLYNSGNRISFNRSIFGKKKVHVQKFKIVD